MNIIIVGCGKVGQALCEQLNEEENNITVIDVDAERVETVSNMYDVMGVVGNGATHAVQKEAGIDVAELLIAVTNSDELNLLCCLVAKKSGNCRTIARIINPEYSIDAPYLKDELGLALLINPEYEAAQEIARLLRFPSAINIETFAKGRVELLKFRLPENSPIIGMSVKRVITELHCDVLICTVERDDEAYIANGDFVFAEKDIISIVAAPKNANDFFKKIEYKSHAVKDAMIIGGGSITHYLCEILHKSGIALKVVEKDKAICNELCQLFPDVDIVNGDAIDKDILLEEGLAGAGALVTLTKFDEENVMLSLYAKSVMTGKVITKISRIEFDDIIKKLEIDTKISPKNITADAIARYIRSMKSTKESNVERLYNVIKGKVEAAEFTVSGESEITGKPLSQLQFKKDVLIASIIRGKEVIIPRGHDMILPGDGVVIVSKLLMMHDITDVLK